MNKIEDFMRRNSPTRMYRIKKKFSIRVGGYSLELRILKEDGES